MRISSTQRCCAPQLGAAPTPRLALIPQPTHWWPLAGDQVVATDSSRPSLWRKAGRHRIRKHRDRYFLSELSNCRCQENAERLICSERGAPPAPGVCLASKCFAISSSRGCAPDLACSPGPPARVACACFARPCSFAYRRAGFALGLYAFSECIHQVHDTVRPRDVDDWFDLPSCLLVF